MKRENKVVLARLGWMIMMLVQGSVTAILALVWWGDRDIVLAVGPMAWVMGVGVLGSVVRFWNLMGEEV